MTVLHNVRVCTMNPQQPEADALAWRGDRILAVGAEADVRAAAGNDARLVDGWGRTVLPGLIDSHIHFMGYATGLLRVDLEGVPSLGEALERVAERSATTQPGDWVRGGGWNNNLWRPNGFPDRADLDRVTGDRPAVMTRKDGHSSWVNSAALAAGGVTRETPDPPGARIGRDASGEPDGMLYEWAAIDLVHRHMPDEAEAERAGAVRQALHNAAAAGLTGFHDIEGPEAFTAFQRLSEAGDLPLRVFMLLALDSLMEGIELGLRTGFGNDRLRLGQVKIFSDGSLGSQTAQMLAPFEGTTDNYGVETISQDDLERALLAAGKAGIGVAVHAIGDAANRRVLDAFARARREESGLDTLPIGPDADGYALYPLRHRIEHAQLVDPADWHRFRELGVIASMQPIHATSDMEAADRLWGERAARGAYAWRTLGRAGARLAFGSDCPVESFDPLLGIHAAVTRRTPAGEPPEGWHAEECLDVTQAVRAYTVGAAYASGEEELKGSLVPGKLADMVLLDRDIFACDPQDIPKTRVTTTIVGGSVVAGAL